MRDIRCQETPWIFPVYSKSRSFTKVYLKYLLKIVYPCKFDIDFYDLICISILMINNDDKMLRSFLCTEIIQTTKDIKCQKVAMFYLHKIINEQTDKKDAYNNNGIHSNLENKIIGYRKLKEFVDENKKCFGEIVIENVKFNNPKIIIYLTSIVEHMTFDIDVEKAIYERRRRTTKLVYKISSDEEEFEVKIEELEGELNE